MVIIKLMGGLGNQLFQYAFARRLALVNNVQLKLDHLTGFEHDFYGRVYSLRHFNINENLLSRKEIDHVQKKGRICRKIIRILERRLRHYNLFVFLQIHLRIGCLFITQRRGGFNKNTYEMKFKKDVYLDGYWGSEEYFIDIENIIREELQVKYPLEGANLKIANKINKTNSISLHIRKLHGISNNGKLDINAVNIHGTIDPEYYHRAVQYLSNKYNNLHFFIFADDPEWTQKNMKLSFPKTYVNINGVDKDYEDLRLMSLCKHNIIANSTFSWWGAWLNNNPDKIVIAPKKWFKDPAWNSKINFEDLYPKEWIIL